MTFADLQQLEPAWERLWQRDPRATPFQSPAWLIPWTRHLWGGGELLVFTEYRGGELTGFLPLFRWGNHATTVSFLGAGVSDYGDQLGTFQHLPLPADASLEEVRPDSPLVVNAFAETWSVCPILALANYPNGIDRKLKADLHRAQNKIAKTQARFSLAHDPEEFFRLHALRWQEDADATLLTFQREVAQGFGARGLLRLHMLHIENAPAAAIFAIAAHGTLYCYLTAFDLQFTKLSPGAVLLAHALDQAKEEGLTHADFLRGAEAYKYLWGAEDRTNFRVRPASPSEMKIPESTEPPK